MNDGSFIGAVSQCCPAARRPGYASSWTARRARPGPGRSVPTRCAGGAGARRGGRRRASPSRQSCCGRGDELSWPSWATSHRNYDGGNPSCRLTFRKYGPLPHLSARSFRPHHGRVFRRVRIGCRGDARGPRTAGTVSRGRSQEKRQLPCPSEFRGPAALGPGAERVDGDSLAGAQFPVPTSHAKLLVSLGRCDAAEASTHARPLDAQPKFASNTARAKPGGVMLRRSPRSSDGGIGQSVDVLCSEPS